MVIILLSVSAMKIGVLDIQGSVEEHFDALGRLGTGVGAVLVKKVEDFEGLAGLILPGGESTTISKLLDEYGLGKEIVARFESGKLAVWGTCAGAILLAKEVSGSSESVVIEPLGLIDIEVDRNAYGRQLDSFETELEFEGEFVPGIFIRAPKIVRMGEGIGVLAECDGKVVAAREGRVLVTTFHPEMTDNLAAYRYFVEMCEN